MLKFNCPNCSSTDYIAKNSLGKKFTTNPYKNVKSEIQCSICFFDIPSNISENIDKKDYEKNKILWNEFYKPEHLKHSPRCSICCRFYWEIEKYLFNKNISRKDIFYQKYNPRNGIGDLVCKICDPKSFI